MIKYTDSIDILNASNQYQSSDWDGFIYQILSFFKEPTYIYTYSELEGNVRRPFYEYRGRYIFGASEDVNFFEVPPKWINLNK